MTSSDAEAICEAVNLAYSQIARPWQYRIISH